MIRSRPHSSVRFAPIRLETTPVTQHRDAHHRHVAGEQQRHLARVASSWSAIGLRIGSTRPMPMNAITQANATAHTAALAAEDRLLRWGEGVVVLDGGGHGVPSWVWGTRSRSSATAVSEVVDGAPGRGDALRDQVGVVPAQRGEGGAAERGER
jgi:hypothetical protein